MSPQPEPVQPGRMTETAWIAPETGAGQRNVGMFLRWLGHLGRAHPWHVGDALLYAEEIFGEKAPQLAEELGWAPQTRMNVMGVCQRFPPARRHPYPLSFGHHALLIRYPPDEQDRWLELAKRGDGPDQPWSISRLRQALRAATGAIPTPRLTTLARGQRVRVSGSEGIFVVESLAPNGPVGVAIHVRRENTG